MSAPAVQSRNIVLAAGSVLVLGLLLLLLMKVNGNASPEVPEDKLAQARAEHQRSQRSAKASASRPDIDRTPSSRNKHVVLRDDEDEDEGETESDSSKAPAATARARRPSIRATSMQPRITLKTGSKKDDGDLRERMGVVNRLYDTHQYEDAVAAAQEILEENPRNVRMLRVVVSAACKMGDAAAASAALDQLSGRNKRQMLKRCEYYGVDVE